MKKSESKKDVIISAASDLFWEKGFESTSPNDVIKRSGAGKGSLYHHFENKSELCGAVFQLTVKRMLIDAENTFDGSNSPLQALENYLTKDRVGLKGCRLGRHASEQSVLNTPSLVAPLEAYFSRVLELVEESLAKAQGIGELPATFDKNKIATMVVASVQGGFVLSRVTGDKNMIKRACEGAWELITCLSKQSGVNIENDPNHNIIPKTT